MSECKHCHNPLTAINISDIEDDCCQKCEKEIIKNLEIIEPDPEVSNLSDNDLEIISRTLFPTPMHLTNKISHQKRCDLP